MYVEYKRYQHKLSAKRDLPRYTIPKMYWGGEVYLKVFYELPERTNNMKIIRYPNPKLKQVSTNVEVFDDQLTDQVNQMLELLVKSHGVGLAAPQVGIHKRFFITYVNYQMKFYANPELKEASKVLQETQEGCLSLPGAYGPIKRPSKLVATARDLTGEPFDFEATGFEAAVVGHEWDHLDGVLLTDKMGRLTRKVFLRGLKK